ncbi:concanavalin A-like lectin/glucanase superfamily protein [Terracoccus luteus]|uniref:Concanavalin A-like lectin/glucanase superfamily protein n=1 Tax=Terracoccus luteus TaxID=53356 RepID=A0A495Y1T8_9MICO|nr:LamG domain-containing protein [Terracoccus luteus]RKT79609.1 concanavalin A-like lectin/glucanase superfamily protein [Terracoccus luteus]
MAERFAPAPRTRRRPRAIVVACASAAVALGALTQSTPLSTAAFSASVRNSTNTIGTAASFTTATCAGVYRASAPAIWYRLDELTGTAATDSSTAGTRTGTYQGSPTKGVPTACPRDTGYAVTFNGSTDYVSYTTALSTPLTYSAELWFRTTTNRGGLLVGFGASPTGLSTDVDRILYLTNSGQVVFGVNTALKNAITSPGTYRDGAWHHVMATAGLNGLRLYVDGTQVASSALTLSVTFTGAMRVGFDNLAGWPSAPTSNFLAATLDEVAVYNKTLTAADAAAHYSAGQP